ncbi:zeta toxin family protein [uncultured Bifidobacterium sp.]|uniref:nSTAND3 domain-containing NTPase n=1 Tax=uncultured Bifidobacterium sp. TaxID=165187 RepID=UPI00259360BF|nr:zeta toxin family protein [uncultured Bifidobacterium sp.]
MDTQDTHTRLIIVEGLPGSGKSTTAEMIAADLRARGRDVVCVDEGTTSHPADVGDYDFPRFRDGTRHDTRCMAHVRRPRQT